ncbi:hypothetical protein KAFR_0F03980 [Kazachstania africana CBS 2517]|uniref:Uncharacterized protein n=1 Tax=Kazachstania africana (strain ATCC 22294 / BCRC 22015 / CBS 2517 / CECT 1963 / NBRC 1671 / NRRL Y-8276) TaxID=1071382 RepID=H2AX93_KAZAF|nr:hypothetical protein KAFR_0F03980 [Kazachstania africana CBS 2517]CCF58993.1 hypothetical protein KAFR_0F03980 [Kazachstania africana CBS 2517]
MHTLKPSVQCLKFKRCYVDRNSLQYKTANLGEITKYLTNKGVPNLLQGNLCKKYLDADIQLRLFPTIFPYLPTIKGSTKYSASMNAIRLIIEKFVLSNGHQKQFKDYFLHVMSVKSYQGHNIRTLPSKEYKFLTENDKLIIKWRTCAPNLSCSHLLPLNSAKLDEGWSHHSRKLLDYVIHPAANQNWGTRNDFLSTEDKNVTRLLSGVFIFELNDDSSRIAVHTIDNIELIDFSKKSVTNEKNALAC